MRIVEVTAEEVGILKIVAEDGRRGTFDVRPYFSSPAFRLLTDWAEFSRVRNGGYYIEWKCGADLSADTIEARWKSEATVNAQQTDVLNSDSAALHRSE